MVVQTQTEEMRRLRRTNLELIFSDHNAYCLPPCQNKCPSHIDIPGFLKANAEANWRESTRIFKRTIPFPSVLGRVCPAPCEEHCRRDEVDEAIAIRDSHRYAGDQVIRAMLDEDVDPPLPFEQQAASGRRAAVIGSGPAGMAAAYYLLLSGHDVTVFERDPSPGGMLRYGIPQYRLPKVEVLEAEYESVVRLGGKMRCNMGLGRDFTLDDLQNQGFDAVVVAIGCYDTNKLGIPGEDADGVIDGLEYLRTATLGLPYPGHAGTPRGRRRRRLHVDGLLADVDPPGRQRGHARLPPRHEGHAGEQRGPRGHRGGRHRHLPGGPDARHHRREDRQGHRHRVHPDAAGRARRLRPPPPGARARHRVHDPLRPRAAGDRPGPGARLDPARVRGPGGHEAAAPRRRRRDLRDRAARRVRHRRRPDRRGDRRPGDRRGPARRLRRGRLPQGQRPVVDPRPPDARRAAARVPLDRAVHRRDQGAALPPQGARGRGPQPQLHRVRDPVHPGRRDGRVHALPPVHVRGDRVLRPAPPRASSTARRSRRSSPRSTRAPATAA